MEEHQCLKENELGKISSILDKVSKEVYGNGEVGLSKSVPRMEEKINNLTSSVAAHTVVVTKLLEFQTIQFGEGKAKKEIEDRQLIASELKVREKRDRLQRIFWFVMALIGIIGICVSVFLGVKGINQNEINAKKIENLGEPVITNKRGEQIPLPTGTQIRMYPKDFKGPVPDSVKKQVEKLIK